MTALPLLLSPRYQTIADVSQANGPIDAVAMRSFGIAAIVVKAAEGLTCDGLALEHMARARDAGLPCAAYGYARVTSAASPEEQAQRLVECAGDEPLPFGVLDLEASGGLSGAALVEWAARWVFALQLTSTRAVIYSYDSFVREHLSRVGWHPRGPELVECPLWLAAYPGGLDRQHTPTEASADRYAAPPPWGAWKLWQYAGNGGRCPGGGARTDLSLFRGTPDELAAFFAPA